MIKVKYYLNNYPIAEVMDKDSNKTLYVLAVLSKDCRDILFKSLAKFNTKKAIKECESFIISQSKKE